MPQPDAVRPSRRLASLTVYGRGDGYAGGAFHSIEMGIACLSLLLMGPGWHSLDELARAARRKSRAARPG